MENLTGTQLGPYKLIERIGRGGMSAVYRATGDQYENEVAVKVMDTNPDTREIFMRRFEQEANIVAEMRHPNILPLLDYGRDGIYPYMVTPLITGGTLADVLRLSTLSAEETGGWLYQIGSALDHAHQRGVVHRDLKPTNILLDEDGNAFLTDFGIAKILKKITGGGGLTVTGNVLGTPTYMAPEQWRGEDATPLTDVYGLGILIYLMMAGKPPFQADTPHSLMYKHLNEPPPPIRLHVHNISEAIEQVVAKALAKDPRYRYPSASEFSHDFQRALHGLETLAQREPPPRPGRQRPQQAYTPVRPPVNPSIPSYYPPQMPPMVSTPYYPSRSPQKRQQNRWRSCVLFLLLLALIGGFAGYISQNPDDWLPQEITYEPVNNTFWTPTPTTMPGTRPSVTIDFPQNGRIFAANTNVLIGVTTSDSITKLEIRRFGFVVQTVTNLSNPITYIPRQPGRHIIEIIPYRGNLPGDSAFLEINVQ